MTVVEVFADVACPFTHVGLKRFVRRRDELGRGDVKLLVRAWPLELVNGTPMDPDFIAEEIDDIRNQIGGEFFTGFDRSSFPSTSVPALALAAAANARDLETGEAVSLHLRDLLFEQGVDISDRVVLSGIASDHGLDVDLNDDGAVLADHAEGAERAVIGSPHFFTPGGDFFCPALDVSRSPDGHLAVTADPVAFDRFMDACLS